MAKHKLIVKFDDEESNVATVRYGDKVTARGVVADGFLIRWWCVHEPYVGWDEKALKAMKKRFVHVGVYDGGSNNKQDFARYDKFYYWMEMFGDGLVDAVRYYDKDLKAYDWVALDYEDIPGENPRGGKRHIPRKTKKMYWGISNEVIGTGLDYDLLEKRAQKISRHLFMQHLYKHSKRRELPYIEEMAGYLGNSRIKERTPMSQDDEVGYFLSTTRDGKEVVYFKTPHTGDTMFLWWHIGRD